MNPHQKNKIDISSLNPEEQKLFRLYGKLPNRSDLLQNKLKERKYFDSGDYALSKAGKAGDVGVTQVGREHPNPESIPHLSPTTSATGSESQQNGQRTSISGPSGSVGDGIRLPPAMQQKSGAKSGSPVKENSMMHRSVSVDEQEDGESAKGPAGFSEAERNAAAAVSPPPAREGMPIRGGQ